MGESLGLLLGKLMPGDLGRIADGHLTIHGFLELGRTLHEMLNGEVIRLDGAMRMGPK